MSRTQCFKPMGLARLSSDPSPTAVDSVRIEYSLRFSPPELLQLETPTLETPTHTHTGLACLLPVLTYTINGMCFWIASGVSPTESTAHLITVFLFSPFPIVSARSIPNLLVSKAYIPLQVCRALRELVRPFQAQAFLLPRPQPHNHSTLPAVINSALSSFLEGSLRSLSSFEFSSFKSQGSVTLCIIPLSPVLPMQQHSLLSFPTYPGSHDHTHIHHHSDKMFSPPGVNISWEGIPTVVVVKERAPCLSRPPD